MEIRILNGETISAGAGESIYEALKGRGIYLVASCGGKGVCGKCRVKILDGRVRADSTGKLKKKEIEENLALACRTFPEGDIFIEIPEGSRLIVGDKIAVSKSKDLMESLRVFGGEIVPMVTTVHLKIDPPTIEDHVSDLDRLVSELEKRGFTGVRFSHGFLQSLAGRLRSSKWDVNVTLSEGPDAV